MTECLCSEHTGFNLRTKYKGHHNRNTQIRATFSQDGTFLLCGSDDGWVYIWTTGAGTEDDKMPKQVGFGACHMRLAF